MTTITTTICRCGHHYRVHSIFESGDCRGCGCHTFTPAQDDVEAAAATEAARAHAEHRERAYNQLRRAVAGWHFEEARRLLDQLQAVDE